MKHMILAAALISAASNPSSASEPRFITNPSDEAVLFMYYKAAKVEPPYEELAKTTIEYNRANEFDRAKVSEEIQNRLRDAAKAAEYDGIVVSLSYCSISEYDDTYKEFALGCLSDTSAIETEALGRKVNLLMTNGTAASSWRLTREEASAAFSKNQQGRVVDITLRMVIEGASPPPASANRPYDLRARIISYDIKGNVRGSPTLGRVTVE